MIPRVLIVDDVPPMLQLIRRIVGDALGADADVRAESDARMALVHLAVSRFDLVITDLRMPGAGGLDVLREAKRQSSRTEVLIVTAFASATDICEAQRMGAFACLEKPFDPDDLADRVRDALSRSSPGLPLAN